jgi:hypothetical protein
LKGPSDPPPFGSDLICPAPPRQWRMDFESLATHEGFDFLKAAIRSTYGKARRRRLIAETIRELLALDPDIDAADARMRAAKALGIPSDALELRADRLLDATLRQRARGTDRKRPKKISKRRSVVRMAPRNRP